MAVARSVSSFTDLANWAPPSSGWFAGGIGGGPLARFSSGRYFSSLTVTEVSGVAMEENGCVRECLVPGFSECVDDESTMMMMIQKEELKTLELF